MFERFDARARAVVVSARDEARDLGHGWIGTEHLLLGVLHTAGGRAVEELAGAGLTVDVVREAIRRRAGPGDADALRAIGIDLDAVRARVEATFGPGALDAPRRPGRRRRRARHRLVAAPCHTPFTPRAKKTLELALRHAVRLRSDRITPDHVALGVLTEGRGLAVQVLVERGVEPSRLQARIEAGMRAA